LREQLAPLMNDVEITAWRFTRPDSLAFDIEVRRRTQEIQKNIPAAIEARRAGANADILSAYNWVAFVCTYGDRASRERDALVEPIQDFRDTATITYRMSTCGVADRDR